MVSSVEQKVKIIYIVETVLLVISVVKSISVLALAIFFSSEFDDYVSTNLSREQHEVFETLGTPAKYSLVFLGIIIGLVIDVALWYYLRRGIQNRRSLTLTRWSIVGWILVVLTAVSLGLALIQNRPRGPVQTLTTFYSMVYVTYKVFANIFVLMFAGEVKGEVYDQMPSFNTNNLEKF